MLWFCTGISLCMLATQKKPIPLYRSVQNENVFYHASMCNISVISQYWCFLELYWQLQLDCRQLLLPPSIFIRIFWLATNQDSLFDSYWFLIGLHRDINDGSKFLKTSLHVYRTARRQIAESSTLTMFYFLSPFSCCSHLEHIVSVKRFVALQSLNLRTVGRTSWTGDQPAARPLPNTE
jgi:hypothetical protein